ncbi:MAG: hypothetical protein RSF73_09905 [Ruthenibacterium sp.]
MPRDMNAPYYGIEDPTPEEKPVGICPNCERALYAEDCVYTADNTGEVIGCHQCINDKRQAYECFQAEVFI